MSKGFWERWMDIAVAGTALASSTTKTSLMLGNTGEKATLPAKYFERIGKSLKIRLAGRISTVVTTPGTLQIGIAFGAIDVWLSGLMTLNTVAKVNVPWLLELELVARAIGDSTSANVIGVGTFMSEAVLASAVPTAGGELTHILPYNTAPAPGNGFDSTSSQLLDVNGQWSVSNAANSLRLETVGVDVCN